MRDGHANCLTLNDLSFCGAGTTRASSLIRLRAHLRRLTERCRFRCTMAHRDPLRVNDIGGRLKEKTSQVLAQTLKQPALIGSGQRRRLRSGIAGQLLEVEIVEPSRPPTRLLGADLDLGDVLLPPARNAGLGSRRGCPACPHRNRATRARGGSPPPVRASARPSGSPASCSASPCRSSATRSRPGRRSPRARFRGSWREVRHRPPRRAGRGSRRPPSRPRVM